MCDLRLCLWRVRGNPSLLCEPKSKVADTPPFLIYAMNEGRVQFIACWLLVVGCGFVVASLFVRCWLRVGSKV